MGDFLLVQRRLDLRGARPRVLAVRLSFVRFHEENWNRLGRLTWTKWVEVNLNLEGARSREMIQVTPQTLGELINSQLDFVRLMEREKRAFDAILQSATRGRRAG